MLVVYTLSHDEWNLKKCLVHVQNDDNMCAARAIGICLSYLRDGPSSSRYKNMKHIGRNEQRKYTKDLHDRANVPITTNGVGLDDMRKLAVASDREVNVVCWENNHQIIHACNKNAKDKFISTSMAIIIMLLPRFMRFKTNRNIAMSARLGLIRSRSQM